MYYKGCEIEEMSPGSVLVTGEGCFDLEKTFECGQCFRWKRQDDGSYTGIAMGKVVNVRYAPGPEAGGCRGISFILGNSTIRDFIDIWYDYFDLGRDYDKVIESISRDSIMKEAASFGRGIRLLRQDIWETAISFIFSTNKKIPMIADTIEKLCRTFGDPVRMPALPASAKTGRNLPYTFPDVRTLASADLMALNECRGGYRCGYVSETAKILASAEDEAASEKMGAGAGIILDRERLALCEADEARKRLMTLPGVGPKVADCILLFSGTRYDVFPTDVWIKRVMSELYFGREAGTEEIRKYAVSYFGEYSGFAQEYLFYYARQKGIGAR